MTGTNETRDLDPILAAWLDDGPTHLPDATRRAILTALPTTPQAPRGLLAPWRLTRMNMLARGASLLVVAVAVIGGLTLLAGPGGGLGGPGPSPVPSTPAPASPSPSPVPSPLASAPPLPTLDATFISPLHGYQVKYPTGWTVTPGTAPWPPGTARYPGNPISDSIVRPAGGDQVRLSGASIALPSGMTMDQFRAFASPLSAPFNTDPCYPVAPLPTPLTIAYRAPTVASPQPVEAVPGVNGCTALAEFGGFIYDVEVIAGGRGYTFTIDGHITKADALAWLASITLEPASAPTGSAAPAPSASQ